MAFLDNLSWQELVHLLQAYDAYITQAGVYRMYDSGWKPSTVEDFYYEEFETVWKNGGDFSKYFLNAAAIPAAEITPQALASAIDEYYWVYDTYNYKDEISDREASVHDLEETILHGDIEELKEHLRTEAEETNIASAKLGLHVLIDQLTQYQKLSRERAPVQAAEVSQTPPADISEDLIEISCYADQVLPRTDNDELWDDYACATFVVPRAWAEEQAVAAGYEDLEDFLDNYTWDTTEGWYQAAFEDGALHSVKILSDRETPRWQPTQEHCLTTEKPQPQALPLKHVSDLTYERLLRHNGSTSMRLLPLEYDAMKKAGFCDLECARATELAEELFEISNVNTRPAMVQGNPALILCCSFDEVLGLAYLGEDRAEDVGAIADMKAETLKAHPVLKDLNISVGHKTAPGFHNEIALILPVDMSNAALASVCDTLKGEMFTLTKEEQEWIEGNDLEGYRDMISAMVHDHAEAGYYTAAEERQLSLCIDEMSHRAFGALYAYCRDKLGGDMDKINLSHETDIYDHVIAETAKDLSLPVQLFVQDLGATQHIRPSVRGEVLEAMRATLWPNMSVDQFLGTCSREDSSFISEAVVKLRTAAVPFDKKVHEAMQKAGKEPIGQKKAPERE